MEQLDILMRGGTAPSPALVVLAVVVVVILATGVVALATVHRAIREALAALRAQHLEVMAAQTRLERVLAGQAEYVGAEVRAILGPSPEAERGRAGDTDPAPPPVHVPGVARTDTLRSSRHEPIKAENAGGAGAPEAFPDDFWA